jgi:putative flippase GtrA
VRDRRAVGEVLRFLLVGGANTVLTYLLLLGLTYVVDPRLAYTVAFVAGVVANVLLTGRLVFGSRPTARRRALYAGWLGVVYLVGLATVQLALVAGVRAEPVLAALPLLMTAPLNFLGGRLLLVAAVPPHPLPRRA